MNNLIAIVEKWPSFLVEIRQEDDDESSRNLVFVVKRSNSYPISEEMKIVLQLLEDHQFTVKIRVIVAGSMIDLTLEQFERQGAFVDGGRISKTAFNKQGMYNLRSQLNKMMKEVEKLPDDSPQFAVLTKRISHIKAMLDTVEPSKLVTPEALKASDEALRRLEMLFNTPQPEGDKQDVTSKPAAASEINATNTASEGMPATVVSPDRREGD